jgi:hypothetical protein
MKYYRDLAYDMEAKLLEENALKKNRILLLSSTTIENNENAINYSSSKSAK